jgi:hypothetical protein
MSTYPATPYATVRFGGGAIFQNSLVLGDLADGILGTNILGGYDVTDVPQVQQIAIRRGRSSLDQTFSAGTATVTFQDETGEWNPNNTSGPYYGQLVPGIQLTVRVTKNLVNYNLFAGYIRSYDYQWDIGDPYATVTLTAVDALYLFNLAAITNVTGTSAGQLPGDRINDLLDELDWPASARAIDPGTVTLQDDPGTDRQLLTALRTVAATDLGAFFIDTAGRATFFGRDTISVKASSTPVGFRDDGTDTPYQQIDYSFDDDQIINQATVTRVGGTAQTATDAASVTQYFKRSYEQSGLLMEDDARALQQANSIVAYRAQPRLRVNTVGVLVTDDTTFDTAVGLDFADPIVVEKEYAGNTIELLSTVQGVQHTINTQRWVTQFTTSEALSYAFILGSSQFGILGTNTL